MDLKKREMLTQVESFFTEYITDICIATESEHTGFLDKTTVVEGIAVTLSLPMFTNTKGYNTFPFKLGAIKHLNDIVNEATGKEVASALLKKNCKQGIAYQKLLKNTTFFDFKTELVVEPNYVRTFLIITNLLALASLLALSFIN